MNTVQLSKVRPMIKAVSLVTVEAAVVVVGLITTEAVADEEGGGLLCLRARRSSLEMRRL
jgi:hypothetical protein